MSRLWILVAFAAFVVGSVFVSETPHSLGQEKTPTKAGEAKQPKLEKQKPFAVINTYINTSVINDNDPVNVVGHAVDVSVTADKALGVYPSKVWCVIYQGASPTIPDMPPGAPVTAPASTSGDTTLWNFPNIAVRDTAAGAPHTIVTWLFYTSTSGTLTQTLYQRSYVHFKAVTFSPGGFFALNGPLTEGAYVAGQQKPPIMSVVARKVNGADPVRVLYKHLPGKQKGPFLIEKNPGAAEASPVVVKEGEKSVKHWTIPVDTTAATTSDRTTVIWAVYTIRGVETYFADSIRYTIGAPALPAAPAKKD